MVLVPLYKKQYDKERAYLISHGIERTLLYDDSEVPIYLALVKMILKRKWTENDMGKHSAYINAADKLSPYDMMDLSDNDVVCMQQEHEDIINTYFLSTSKFKSARFKLVAQKPQEVEAFMVMIKRFINLLFDLSLSSDPSKGK